MSTNVVLEIHDLQRTHRGAWLRFTLGLGVLALIALAGYGVFILYATGGPTLAERGYLLVAVVAGVGAFFSPCSFPLLPSYFAYSQEFRRERSHRSSRLEQLTQGSAAAAGVVTFNVILGLVFATLGLGVSQSLVLLSPTPSPVTVSLRGVVAALMIALGIVQVAGLPLHGALLERITEFFRSNSAQRGSWMKMFLYGFGYTLIGIGCTAPFLASVVVLSLAAGGFFPALAGFLTFSLTMSGLMILVSLTATGSRRHLLKNLTSNTPKIKTLAGTFLTAFGFLLLVLSLWPGILKPLFP